MFEIAWHLGGKSERFWSAEAAAESVDAQFHDAPLPGRLTVDEDWRLRDDEGRLVGEICETESEVE